MYKQGCYNGFYYRVNKDGDCFLLNKKVNGRTENGDITKMDMLLLRAYNGSKENLLHIIEL